MLAPATRSRRQTQQSCPARPHCCPAGGWEAIQQGSVPACTLQAAPLCRASSPPSRCCCGRGAATYAGPKSASTPPAPPSQLAMWAAAGVLESCPRAVAQLLPGAAQVASRDLARILALHPGSRHDPDRRVVAKAALASEALACLAENGLTARHLQSLLRCSTTPRQVPLPRTCAAVHSTPHVRDQVAGESSLLVDEAVLSAPREPSCYRKNRPSKRAP